MGWNPFKSESSSSSEATPYGPAKGVMDTGLGMLGDVGNTPWGTYQGQRVAGFGQDQNRAMNDMRSNYWGQGRQGVNSMYGTGNELLGAGRDARSFYGNQMGMNPMDTAAQYANSPYMDSMVDSASRDVVRNLGENTIPGITSASTSSGNLGSSRRGMLEGIATRGAADRIADIGANLRGNAYSQGMNIGNQNMMNSANAMANMGMQGGNYLTSGANMYNNMYGNMMNQGGMQQGLNQQYMDDAQRQHYMGQQLPLDQANALLSGSLPAAQAFGKTTQTNTSNPGWGNALANVGMQVGSAMLTGGIPLGGGGTSTPSTPSPIGSGMPSMPTQVVQPQQYGNVQSYQMPYYNPQIGGY